MSQGSQKRTLLDYWATNYRKAREKEVNDAVEEEIKRMSNKRKNPNNTTTTTDWVRRTKSKVDDPPSNTSSKTTTATSSKADKWDSFHVKLPCSSSNTYKARVQGTIKSKWYLIQTLLKQKITSAYDLQETISTIKTCGDKTASSVDMTMFVDFFQSYISREEYETFFEQTLPFMQSIALKISELFPEPIPMLRKQVEATLILTSEQIACLMAHAFFCTFPRRDKNFSPTHEYSTFPNMNFSELYKGTRSIKSEKMMAEKLKCIVHYFHSVSTETDQRSVEFQRRVLVDATLISSQDSMNNDSDIVNMWKSSELKICPCEIRVTGSIEDEPDTSQIDFANRLIGGGVIGKGCVQEEIRFLINTECILSRLFTEELDDNECLIIRGAKRYCNYTGYSETFEFGGPATTTTTTVSTREEIVCIDALNFGDRSQFQSTTDQYLPKHILRELNKAYCAFLKLPTDVYNHDMKIATGHWGGGAFAGDREMKAIIQLMAATQAQRTGVIYFAYGDESFVKNFEPMCSLLKNLGATVSELYSTLVEYRDKRISHRQKQRQTGSRDPPPSLLVHICDWFAGEECNPSVEYVEADSAIMVNENILVEGDSTIEINEQEEEEEKTEEGDGNTSLIPVEDLFN